MITQGALMNTGQICMSTERVIVQRSVAEALSKAVKQQFAELKAGGEGSPLGPLFTELSAERVIGLIREAQAAGAEVLVGDVKREGNIVHPHMVSKVTQDMRLWREETFGPGEHNVHIDYGCCTHRDIVIVFVEVDSIDEAVEKANDTEYTLAASLWTQSVHNAFQVAPRIRAGQWIDRFLLL